VRKSIIAFLFCSIFALCSVCADVNLSVNESMVPYSNNLSLQVELVPNATIFINKLSGDLNVSFANNVSLGDASFVNLSFFVNFNPVNLSVPLLLNASFNISNNFSDVSYLYNIYLNYTPSDSFLRNLSGVNESWILFVNVLNGDYLVNITTNFLPLQKTLTYNISGTPNASLNISCSGDWLSCPSQTFFDSSGRNIFDVVANLPLSATDGEHRFNISFSMGNITLVRNIVFFVSEPDISLLSYQFTDKCFVTYNGVLLVTLECINEKEQFDIKRISQYLDRIKALQNQSTEACKPKQVNFTEYVVVGDVDKDLKLELDTCRVSANKKDELITSASQEFNNLNTNFGVCQQALANNESTCLQNVFNTSVALKKDAEDSKKHYQRVFIWENVFLVLLIVSIILGSLFYKSKMEDGWKW
jgi:hypothetical protein